MAKEEIHALLESSDIAYKDCDAIDEVKYASELGYWKKRFDNEGGGFGNFFYKQLMPAIANEDTDDFMKDKIVADFGCGPRGSLAWTDKPNVKAGIDVLTQQYFAEFGSEMLRHNMFYITCDERYIPLPNESVDVLFTINALDHVRNLKEMCYELVRIVKKGGLLLASFNLFEPATACEPQTLNEDKLKNCLLDYFDIETYRIAKKDNSDTYKCMVGKEYLEKPDGSFPCILWVRARKK